MTARITRLRIAGFKSFADPATVEILPGLTGIVGPNGCGKSNVVEALRWAMGESSARALRGGELDDLIFAGTVSRPARNLAEVTLWLEDAIGLAPAPFADSPEIEVTRRAERGSGSEFRVNGKLLRARDVTTMFADLSSGARSSSIVSQNRVGALINARPDERRALLEEAAGITGLHARRHDAELRLRQAESNMARAEDLRLQLEERLTTLGAQTEQARAYRDLSENIRKSEVELQSLLHARAAFAVSRTSEALARIRSELTDATARAADATAQEKTHAARIGPARTEVETTRTRLERLRVLLESAVQAEAQADNALSAAKTRLNQGQRDAEAAIQRLAEIEHTLRQDIAEHEAVAEDEKGLPKRRDAARTDSDKAAEHLLHAEQTASAAEETLLRLRMEADASQKAHAAIVARIRAAEAETESLGKELNALSARLPAEAEIETLTQRQAAAEHELALAETAVRNAAATHQDASIAARLGAEALLRAEASVREEQAEHEKLRARIASLEEQEALLRVQHAEATSNLLPDEARHALEFRLAGATQNLEEARTAEEHAAAASTSAERTLLLAASNRKDGAQGRSRAEQDFRQVEAALRRATERHERLVAEHETATRQLLPENDVAEARSTLEIQELAFARLLAEITTLEQQTERVRQDRSTCDARLTNTLTEHTRLNARRDGLGDEPEENALPHPVLDLLDVPEHLTLAVAAALGEGAQASLGPDAAPRNWFSIDASASTTPLPAGATPVNTLMDVPQELTRFFAALGLVEKDTDGGRLQPHLAPGQCLVANNGALWRWDGYHEAGDQPSRTALILNRRRQVAELSAEIAALENAIPALQSARAEAHARLAETEEQLAKARISREPAERALTDARSHVARCVSTQENASSRLADVARQLEDAAEALADARQRHGDATGTMNALPDAAMLDTAEATARRDKEAAHAEFEASRKLCRERENTLDAAKETLRNALARHDTATGRLETLTLTIARLHQDLAQARTDEQTQFGDASTQALTQARADAERLSEECARTSETLERARAEQAHLGEEAQKIVAQLRERSELRIALTSRESALLPRLDTARSSLAEARNDERTLAPIHDPAPAEQAAQEARAHVVMARENVERARMELATLTSAAARASERRTELQTRIGNNASRAETLRRERDELSERLLAAQAAHTEAAMLPEQLRVSSASQRQELAQTEELWEKAQADLYRIEELLEGARQECQKQEQRVLSGRENEIRLQERLDQAQAARQALIAAGPPPEGCDAPDDLSNQAETKLRRRLAQLLSDRDALGPVNLRAEQEHREASEQAGTLAREHDDLQSAISRLRGSIGNLNREGRERLQAVFTEVDRHFQLLFSRMFGGGRAHLGLVGSDDPLEAGLEIFAQPPGKKLSTLSLLSGGEQALTAISLIFATFRCHPAPICVLDEVDAPLDDANVERLCGLIRDIALEAQTRFVVVTHHQLTMAHMDRLFGVTMQERGVSQVLSVDLSRATAMIDGAGAA